MKSQGLLKNVDSYDVDDLLVKVEKSFDIKFGKTELVNIATFGELCDHIAGKIELDHSDDCTTRQAFYKLREAISSTLGIDNRSISPDLPLTDLLPRQNRCAKIAELENHLGFKLNILRPPQWVIYTFLTFCLASLALIIFTSWQVVGVSGLVISIGGLWLARKIGNEFDVRTAGQVVEKMARENYLRSRRNPTTFNRNEIEKVLADLFSNDLGLDRSLFEREARFV